MNLSTRRLGLTMIGTFDLELAHDANVVTWEVGIGEADDLGKVLLVDLAEHSGDVERILGVENVVDSTFVTRCIVGERKLADGCIG